MTEHTTHNASNEVPYGYCHCGCGQKTKIASRNFYDRGIVKGEPYVFCRGHNGSDRHDPIEKRFWKRVQIGAPQDCWLWTGSVDDNGYGMLSSGTGDLTSTRQGRASRLSYEIANGPIPAGMVVCHHCDNPRCVNPSHLFLGSQSDNTRDMVAKRRQARGTRHSQVKLTEENIHEIRRRLLAGETQKTIAEHFHVDQSTISNIATGETWQHVA